MGVKKKVLKTPIAVTLPMYFEKGGGVVTDDSSLILSWRWGDEKKKEVNGFVLCIIIEL